MQSLMTDTPGRVPNNLGSWDNGGETFPDLTVRPIVKSITSSKNDPTTSASIFLRKVANWDGKSRDIDTALTAAFDAKDYPECIKDLRALRIDPSSYINNLDTVSPHSVSNASSLDS